MKRFFGTFLLVITALTIWAQSPKSIQLERDSLAKLLASSQPDTQRVLLLSNLALLNTRSNHELALKYAREGTALAQKLKFRKGEADCLRRTGIVFSLLGRYPEALVLYQRALSISENINDSFGIAAGYGHIGEIYAEQGDYRKARDHYYKFLNISEATHNDAEKANALIKIGRTFLHQSNFDSATVFYEQAKKIATKNRVTYLLLNLWKDLGELNARKGNKDQAIEFFRKCANYAILANDFIALNESYLGIADLYCKAGRSDSCIFYAQKALQAGQKNNYAKGILNASERLSKAYEPNDPQIALKYLKIAFTVKDSLFNTEKAAQVHNLLFIEQQRRQSLEVAQVEYKNQLKLISLFITLGVFILLAIFLYRNIRNKQRANALLQQKNQEIESTLNKLKSTQAQLVQREKMASLGELTAGIAHEIQNPLNFVNNFSEVNKELIAEIKEELTNGNLEEVKVIVANLEENEQKINNHSKRADSIVKGMLQHSRASSGHKQFTNINALAEEYLRLAYHGLRAKAKDFNVNLITEFDNNLEKVEVVPQELGRVLLNLYNNAFYAIQQKKAQQNGLYQPEVRVSTCQQEDSLEIKVHDNGIGIPESIKNKIFQPFFTTKPTGQGTGLGLSLSYDIITKSHGGEFKVETKEGEFSNIAIILPLNAKKNRS